MARLKECLPFAHYKMLHQGGQLPLPSSKAQSATKNAELPPKKVSYGREKLQVSSFLLVIFEGTHKNKR